MIIFLEGRLGSGKTLGQIYFPYVMSYRAGGVNIAANFDLDSRYFIPHMKLNPDFQIFRLKETEDIREFVAAGGGILLLDEFQRLLDARLSVNSQNIFMSQFVMFLRKLRIHAFFTSQYSGMVDLRIRQVVDVLVRAHKTRGGFRYDVFDGYTGRIPLGQKWISAQQARALFGAYDTNQLIHSLQFPATKKAFDAFLEDIEQAQKTGQGQSQAPAAEPSPDALYALLGISEKEGLTV